MAKWSAIRVAEDIATLESGTIRPVEGEALPQQLRQIRVGDESLTEDDHIGSQAADLGMIQGSRHREWGIL